jgi:predicted nucleic acid-binding protein
MNYLLDTCVVSEYLKKKPSQNVIEWLDRQDEPTLYLSSLVIAELKKGYYKLRQKKPRDDHAARARQVGRWIQDLQHRFDARIVPVDAALLDFWAKLCGRAEAGGKKLPVIDSLITVKAQVHNMIIVTRNVGDFKNCSDDVDVYDPY